MIVPIGTSYGTYGGSAAFDPDSAKPNATMTKSVNAPMTNMSETMSSTNSSNETSTPVKILTEKVGINPTVKQSPILLSNKTDQNQPSSNATLSTNPVNDTKYALQISDTIHKSVAKFALQKSETRKVMLDCRDKIQASNPSNIDKVKSDCKLQLDAIKKKYQDDRTQYHELMQKYRESILVFTRDAKGIKVVKADLDNAYEQIISKMHKATSDDKTLPMMPMGNMTGQVGMGLMATKNNTNCVNPPGGPAIC